MLKNINKPNNTKKKDRKPKNTINNPEVFRKISGSKETCFRFFFC